MFVAHRTWNAESVAKFHRKRDEKRSKKGYPPFDTLSEEDKTAARNEERSSITANEWNWLTLGACPLEKFPSQACIAAADGLLVCPSKFKESRGGPSATKLRFRKGQNLYSIAYNHYSEGLSEPPPGPNYISNDGIRPKRHEYLGPAPCIAGFLLTENETEILFWDTYLKLAWAHQSTWSIEAEFDEKNLWSSPPFNYQRRRRPGSSTLPATNNGPRITGKVKRKSGPLAAI